MFRSNQRRLTAVAAIFTISTVLAACGRDLGPKQIRILPKKPHAQNSIASEPPALIPAYSNDGKGKTEKLLDRLYAIAQSDRLNAATALGITPCLFIHAEQMNLVIRNALRDDCANLSASIGSILEAQPIAPPSPTERKSSQEFLRKITAGKIYRGKFLGDEDLRLFLKSISTAALLLEHADAQLPLNDALRAQAAQELKLASLGALQNLARLQRRVPTWLQDALRDSTKGKNVNFSAILQDREELPSAWFQHLDSDRDLPLRRLDNLAANYLHIEESALAREILRLEHDSARSFQVLEHAGREVEAILSSGSKSRFFPNERSRLLRVHDELARNQAATETIVNATLAILELSSPELAQTASLWTQRFVDAHRAMIRFVRGDETPARLFRNLAQFVLVLLDQGGSSSPGGLNVDSSSMNRIFRAELLALRSLLQQEFFGFESHWNRILTALEQGQNATNDRLARIENQLQNLVESAEETQQLVIGGFQASLLASSNADRAFCFGSNSPLFQPRSLSIGFRERCQNASRHLAVDLAPNAVLNGAFLGPQFSNAQTLERTPAPYLFGWLDLVHGGDGKIPNSMLWQNGVEDHLAFELISPSFSERSLLRNYRLLGESLAAAAERWSTQENVARLLRAMGEVHQSLQQLFTETFRIFQRDELYELPLSFLRGGQNWEQSSMNDLIQAALAMKVVQRTKEFRYRLEDGSGKPFQPNFNVHSQDLVIVLEKFHVYRSTVPEGGTRLIHEGVVHRYTQQMIRVRMLPSGSTSMDGWTPEHLHAMASAELSVFARHDGLSSPWAVEVVDEGEERMRSHLVQWLQQSWESKRELLNKRILAQWQAPPAQEALVSWLILKRQWDILVELHGILPKKSANALALPLWKQDENSFSLDSILAAIEFDWKEWSEQAGSELKKFPVRLDQKSAGFLALLRLLED